MKLITVVNAKNVLEELSNRDDIGTSLAYYMTKFIIQAQEEYDFFVTKMQKIIAKYAETDADGNYVQDARGGVVISAEMVDKFNREVQELQDTEVEAPKVRFTLSALASTNMSMKQIYALMDFIDED